MGARMKRLRRAWRRGRCAQLLVVLLFAAGVLVSAAHRVTTPHRLCEVHGRLEHADDGAHELPTDGDPTGPAYGNEASMHEECHLGPFARTEVALLLPPDPVDSIELRPAGLAALPRAEPRPVSALFLLAPSRSPPA